MKFARLRHFAIGVALVASLGAFVRLADLYSRPFDISREGRSSLDVKSAELLTLLPEPIEVMAFVPATPALRGAIAEFFMRYRRYKANFEVVFIDPRADALDPRVEGARLGEIFVSYQGQRQRIETLNESGTTNALARLARGGDRYITFLASNGERRIRRQGNHDLAVLGDYLERRGLRVREYSLGETTDIPGNTAVLVIASPAIAYAPSELAAIERYLANGGNMLWLTEPDAPAGLAALERIIGVERLKGTVVDPVGLTKFQNPAYAVALTASTHAVVRDFNQTVAMPYAVALSAKPAPGWQSAIVAKTEAQAWTETDRLSGNVGFDEGKEIQGELVLALALTKALRDRDQRIVVVGDGDFLANSFVDNLGNKEFARRLFEWLAADDALIDLAVEPVADAVLDLAMWQRLTLFLFFGVGLPLAFASNGALRWWRRKHA